MEEKPLFPDPAYPPPMAGGEKPPRQPRGERKKRDSRAERANRIPGASVGRRRADGSPAQPNPKARANKARAELEKTLTEAVQSFGAMLMLGGNVLNSPRLTWDGQVIGDRAHITAAAMADVAERAPWVGRAFARLSSGAGALKLLAPVGYVALPIAMNHGLMRPDALGALGSVFLEDLPPFPTSEPAEPTEGQGEPLRSVS